MDKYAECLKSHSHMEGKRDGCQEFMERWDSPLTCVICGCHRNFHRKVPPVVYTKCRKIHEFKFQNSVDGCQEFITRNKEGSIAALTCDICGCHKSFHEKETITQTY